MWVPALALTLSGCVGGVEVSAGDPEAPATQASAGTPNDWRPADSGARAGAEGTVSVDAEGVPISYVVAEGDTPDAIRTRFGLPWFSLARENGEFMPRETMILTGETLTFALPKQ